MLGFKIDVSLPNKRLSLMWFLRQGFYERADLTASGRPLKIDRQMIPPFITRPDNPAANNDETLR